MPMEVETAWADLRPGDRVWVQLMPDGCRGQGGILRSINLHALVIEAPCKHMLTYLRDTDVHHVKVERPWPAEECLDYNPDTCRGPVELRWAGGMNGRSWPRCELHGNIRQQNYENSMELYADSDVVPDWFDPADAGEVWFEEDY